MCGCGKMNKSVPKAVQPKQSAIPNNTQGTNKILIDQLQQQQQLNKITQNQIIKIPKRVFK
jgi:hypothetical protein